MDNLNILHERNYFYVMRTPAGEIPVRQVLSNAPSTTSNCAVLRGGFDAMDRADTRSVARSYNKTIIILVIPTDSCSVLHLISVPHS